MFWHQTTNEGSSLPRLIKFAPSHPWMVFSEAEDSLKANQVVQRKWELGPTELHPPRLWGRSDESGSFEAAHFSGPKVPWEAAGLSHALKTDSPEGSYPSWPEVQKPTCFLLFFQATSVHSLCRVLRLHSPCCGINGLSLPRPQHAATCCPQVEYLVLLFKVFSTNFNAKETGVCWSWDLKCPPPLKVVCAKGSAIAGTVRWLCP